MKVCRMEANDTGDRDPI